MALTTQESNMTAIDTTSIDMVLIWVSRAKKVFIFNAILGDDIQIFKGAFQEQLLSIAEEDGDELLKPMRVELDDFGNLWLY